MTCGRCGGLTVSEYLHDLKDTFEWLAVLRCLNCGHIEDDVIQARRGISNQLSQQGRNR